MRRKKQKNWRRKFPDVIISPQVRLVKVDTEAEQALGARCQIRSIPTLALFANGREVARQPGAMGAADIVRWTRAHL
jgi:thioredoxin 2